MDLFCDFHIDGVRQERERSSGLAAGCRRKVTVVEPLTPPDRSAPMDVGGTPITDNASEVSIGFAHATSETHCRSSMFFFAVAMQGILRPLPPLPLSSSPRAETVMCRLPSLPAYHRLVFLGLDSLIINLYSIVCVLSANGRQLTPDA